MNHYNSYCKYMMTTTLNVSAAQHRNPVLEFAKQIISDNLEQVCQTLIPGWKIGAIEGY